MKLSNSNIHKIISIALLVTFMMSLIGPELALASSETLRPHVTSRKKPLLKEMIARFTELQRPSVASSAEDFRKDEVRIVREMTEAGQLYFRHEPEKPSAIYYIPFLRYRARLTRCRGVADYTSAVLNEKDRRFSTFKSERDGFERWFRTSQEGFPSAALYDIDVHPQDLNDAIAALIEQKTKEKDNTITVRAFGSGLPALLLPGDPATLLAGDVEIETILKFILSGLRHTRNKAKWTVVVYVYDKKTAYLGQLEKVLLEKLENSPMPFNIVLNLRYGDIADREQYPYMFEEQSDINVCRNITQSGESFSKGDSIFHGQLVNSLSPHGFIIHGARRRGDRIILASDRDALKRLSGDFLDSNSSEDEATSRFSEIGAIGHLEEERKTEDLIAALTAFDIPFIPTESNCEFTRISAGHSNLTYNIKHNGKNRHILQQMSTIYDANALNANLNLLEQAQDAWLKEGAEDEYWQPVHYVNVKGASDKLYCDTAGRIWRLMDYIPGEVFGKFSDVPQSDRREIAQSLGRAIVVFRRMLESVPLESWEKDMSGFHDPQYFYAYLHSIWLGQEVPLNFTDGSSHMVVRDPSVTSEYSERINLLKRKIEDRRHILTSLDELGQVVSHGDLKIDNLFFRKHKGRWKCISIADLDTIQPRNVLTDLGDALRSAGNPAGSEPRAIDDVTIDVDVVTNIINGYLEATAGFYDHTEAERLRPHTIEAFKLLLYGQSMWYLADALTNSAYFNIGAERALYKAEVQMRALEQLEELSLIKDGPFADFVKPDASRFGERTAEERIAALREDLVYYEAAATASSAPDQDFPDDICDVGTGEAHLMNEVHIAADSDERPERIISAYTAGPCRAYVIKGRVNDETRLFLRHRAAVEGILDDLREDIAALERAGMQDREVVFKLDLKTQAGLEVVRLGWVSPEELREKIKEICGPRIYTEEGIFPHEITDVIATQEGVVIYCPYNSNASKIILWPESKEGVFMDAVLPNAEVVEDEAFSAQSRFGEMAVDALKGNIKRAVSVFRDTAIVKSPQLIEEDKNRVWVINNIFEDRFLLDSVVLKDPDPKHEEYFYASREGLDMYEAHFESDYPRVEIAQTVIIDNPKENDLVGTKRASQCLPLLFANIPDNKPNMIGSSHIFTSTDPTFSSLGDKLLDAGYENLIVVIPRPKKLGRTVAPFALRTSQYEEVIANMRAKGITVYEVPYQDVSISAAATADGFAIFIEKFVDPTTKRTKDIEEFVLLEPIKTWQEFSSRFGEVAIIEGNAAPEVLPATENRIELALNMPSERATQTGTACIRPTKERGFADVWSRRDFMKAGAFATTVATVFGSLPKTGVAATPDAIKVKAKELCTQYLKDVCDEKITLGLDNSLGTWREVLKDREEYADLLKPDNNYALLTAFVFDTLFPALEEAASRTRVSAHNASINIELALMNLLDKKDEKVEAFLRHTLARTTDSLVRTRRIQNKVERDRRIGIALQRLESASAYIGPEISDKLVSIVKLHDSLTQLGLEQKEEIERVSMEINSLIIDLNKILIPLGLYCRVSMNVSLGDDKEHIYIKSFKIEKTRLYKATDGKVVKVYIVKGIDNIAITNVFGFRRLETDYAVVILDNIESKARDIEEVLKHGKSDAHKDIESRLTAIGKARLADLRVLLVELAKKEFSGLTRQQIMNKIQVLIETHEIRHVLDRGNFTREERDKKEGSAFMAELILAELITGTATYYSVLKWAEHVFRGGEHDYAARMVFEGLMKKAKEKGYVNASVNLKHVSFRELIKTVETLRRLSKGEIAGLARESYKEIFGFEFIDALPVIQPPGRFTEPKKTATCEIAIRGRMHIIPSDLLAYELSNLYNAVRGKINFTFKKELGDDRVLEMTNPGTITNILSFGLGPGDILEVSVEEDLPRDVQEEALNYIEALFNSYHILQATQLAQMHGAEQARMALGGTPYVDLASAEQYGLEIVRSDLSSSLWPALRRLISMLKRDVEISRFTERGDEIPTSPVDPARFREDSRLIDERARDMLKVLCESRRSQPTNTKARRALVRLEHLVDSRWSYGEQWSEVIDTLREAGLITSDTAGWLGSLDDEVVRRTMFYVTVRYLDIMEHEVLFHGTSLHNIDSIKKHGLHPEHVPPGKEELQRVFGIVGKALGEDRAMEITEGQLSFEYDLSLANFYFAILGPEMLRRAIGDLQEIKKLGFPEIDEADRKFIEYFLEHWNDGYLSSNQPCLLAVPFKTIVQFMDLEQDAYQRDRTRFLKRPHEFFNDVILLYLFPWETWVGEGTLLPFRLPALDKIETAMHEQMAVTFHDVHTYSRPNYDLGDIYVVTGKRDALNLVPLKQVEIDELERTAVVLREVNQECQEKQGEVFNRSFSSQEALDFCAELHSIAREAIAKSNYERTDGLSGARFSEQVEFVEDKLVREPIEDENLTLDQVEQIERDRQQIEAELTRHYGDAEAFFGEGPRDGIRIIATTDEEGELIATSPIYYIAQGVAINETRQEVLLNYLNTTRAGIAEEGSRYTVFHEMGHWANESRGISSIVRELIGPQMEEIAASHIERHPDELGFYLDLYNSKLREGEIPVDRLQELLKGCLVVKGLTLFEDCLVDRQLLELARAGDLEGLDRELIGTRKILLGDKLKQPDLCCLAILRYRLLEEVYSPDDRTKVDIFPDDFNPENFGINAEMMKQIDDDARAMAVAIRGAERMIAKYAPGKIAPPGDLRDLKGRLKSSVGDFMRPLKKYLTIPALISYFKLNHTRVDPTRFTEGTGSLSAEGNLPGDQTLGTSDYSPARFVEGDAIAQWPISIDEALLRSGESARAIAVEPDYVPPYGVLAPGAINISDYLALGMLAASGISSEPQGQDGKLSRRTFLKAAAAGAGVAIGSAVVHKVLKSDDITPRILDDAADERLRNAGKAISAKFMHVYEEYKDKNPAETKLVRALFRKINDHKTEKEIMHHPELKHKKDNVDVLMGIGEPADDNGESPIYLSYSILGQPDEILWAKMVHEGWHAYNEILKKASGAAEAIRHAQDEMLANITEWVENPQNRDSIKRYFSIWVNEEEIANSLERAVFVREIGGSDNEAIERFVQKAIQQNPRAQADTGSGSKERKEAYARHLRRYVRDRILRYYRIPSLHGRLRYILSSYYSHVKPAVYIGLFLTEFYEGRADHRTRTTSPGRKFFIGPDRIELNIRSHGASGQQRLILTPKENFLEWASNWANSEEYKRLFVKPEGLTKMRGSRFSEASQAIFGKIEQPTGIIMKADFATKIFPVLPELAVHFGQKVTIAVVGPSQLKERITKVNAVLPHDVSIILCDTIDEAAKELSERGIGLIRLLTRKTIKDLPLVRETLLITEKTLQLIDELRSRKEIAGGA